MNLNKIIKFFKNTLLNQMLAVDLKLIIFIHIKIKFNNLEQDL